MNTKLILFDLDGTLLPMDQDIFVKAYFSGLAKALAPHGYDPQKLVPSIWKGTMAMISNSTEKTNEQVFWDSFDADFGEGAREDEPIFERFYIEHFDEIRAVCGYTERAAEVISRVKAKGLRVALATNPIFPAIATRKRIVWAGLSPEDFELITTYENSKRTKPHPEYYLNIAKELGVSPEECAMIGNDVGEDMVAEGLGMKVFLLTDSLINKTDKDISFFPNGSFDELLAFIEELSV